MSHKRKVMIHEEDSDTQDRACRSHEGAIIQQYPLDHNIEITQLAEKWQAIFNAWPDMGLVIAPDFQIICCNQALAERIGTPQEALIGRDCHEALCQSTHDRSDCVFLDGLNEQEQPREFYHNDWHRFFALSTLPLKDHLDATWGTLTVLRDMTDRKQLQQRLYRSQQTEAIGRLAAGIAHEINTPTQYIAGNLQFFSDFFRSMQPLLKQHDDLLKVAKAGVVPEDTLREMTTSRDNVDVNYLCEEVPNALRDALEGVDRIAHTVDAMRAFSQADEEQPVSIDINALLQSAIIVTRGEWKYVADVATDFDEALPCVDCFSGSFNQAILNLLLNAAEAIAERSSRKKEEKGHITVRTQYDDDSLRIQIGDTGCGIPDDIKSKIFKPFFSTKNGRSGRGHGLAFVYETIVREHHGELTFESDAETGTVFTVQIPISCFDQAHEEHGA